MHLAELVAVADRQPAFFLERCLCFCKSADCLQRQAAIADAGRRLLDVGSAPPLGLLDLL